jgi:small subunit ribosomal protein S20
MPHTASAAKRLRQNEQRRLRNKARSTELKTISKSLLRALNDGKPDEAKNIYRQLTRRLDQAASLKVIHPNHAARTKARMAKRLAAPPPAAKA